jgi:hypothetical protein
LRAWRWPTSCSTCHVWGSRSCGVLVRVCTTTRVRWKRGCDKSRPQQGEPADRLCRSRRVWRAPGALWRPDGHCRRAA